MKIVYFKDEDPDDVYLVLEELEDRIMAEYLYVYPPGIPIIAPGEIVSREIIEKIRNYINNGLNIKTEKYKVVQN